MAIPADVSADLPIFAELDTEELEIVVGHSQRIELEAGATVFAEGDAGSELLLVLAGEVEVVTKIATDVDRTLLTLRRGGVFGELALVTGDVRSGSARVSGNDGATLLALSKADFEAICAKHTMLANKLQRYLLGILSERLGTTTQLYRQAVSWGLNISAVIELNYHQLIVDKRILRIDLASGESVTGQLLKVEKSPVGDELLLETEDGDFAIVPYHAVAAIVFPKEQD